MKLASAVFIFVMLGLLVIFNSCGSRSLPEEESAVGDVVDDGQNPHIIQAGAFQGEKNFAYLLNHHAAGKAEPTPWAGFWWPYVSNGIASGAYGSGNSPAGKYDAARGRRTDAQGWEIKNHGSAVPQVQGWWGHCNGWTAAAALFPEPTQEVTVNGVTFGIGDIKALLTEAAMEVSADFYGNRVDFGQDFETTKFWDTVPDQYFLLLTNFMGKAKKAVLVDRFTGDQVWNQPLVGYRFEYPKPQDYLGADPQAPNVYRINMTSTIWWARDDVVPDVQTGPFNYEDSGVFESRTLKSEIWLDGPVVFGADGRIQSSGNVIVTREGDFLVGGTWRNGEGYYNEGHPDYMWIPYSVLKPTEYANPHIDIEWIRAHILSGGVDDPSVNPSPVVTAPSPSPYPSSLPSGWPGNWPTTRPTSRPTYDPEPYPTSTGRPAGIPEPFPTPTTTMPTERPTSAPIPIPIPIPIPVPIPEPVVPIPIPPAPPIPVPTGTGTPR